MGHIRSIIVIDGKRLDLTDKFAFQTVQPWTDVVFIDDPHQRMSIVPLFNMISGDMSAEGKGTKPIIKPIKLMIASNWVLETGGTSETGRQFVTQLDDFYIRYAKEHKDTIQPIVDLHGKEFFTDWNEKDWAEFDSFSVRALIHHLSSEAPANTIVSNAKVLRFIQVHEEELFFDLANSLIQNLSPITQGRGHSEGWMVSRQALTSIIQEHNEGNKVKPGKIAREFLSAVGAEKIEVTSAKAGGQIRMMYKIDKGPEALDLGAYKIEKK